MMVTPKWVRSRTPPIALSNLLHYLGGLVEADGVDGQIFNAAGPELLSYQQQLRSSPPTSASAAPSSRCRFSARASAWWLQFVTSVPQPVAKALVGGLKHDIPADDGPLRPCCRKPCSASTRRWPRASLEQQLGPSSRGDPLGLRWRHPEYGFYDRTASGDAICPPRPRWCGRCCNNWGRAALLLNEPVGGARMDGSPDRRPGADPWSHQSDRFVKGDMLDSWQIRVDEGRRLDLLFNMRAPASAGWSSTYCRRSRG